MIQCYLLDVLPSSISMRHPCDFTSDKPIYVK